MKILYILNGLGFSRKMPIGGADKRALEVGQRLREKGVKVSFLTTDAGREVLEKWGLKAEFVVVKRPFFWPYFLENNLLGRILAYFYTVLAITCTQRVAGVTVVYSTSDQFFDLLPAVFLKLFGRSHPTGVKFVGIVHHWIPSPFKRGGNFVVNVLLYFTQKFGFLILKLFADLIFIPKTNEGKKIGKSLESFGVRKERLAPFLNGVNLREIAAVPEQEKKYEACFLGGLRPSKGIFDLVPVWRKVLEEVPRARLLVVGGGVERYEKKLKAQSSKLKSGSIVLAGVLSQSELFRTVKSCKIFISPSYEEGWGIGVGEALACGLPVVAYDLPAYKPFGGAVEKVPVGDRSLLAKKIIRFLKDDSLRRERVTLGTAVVREFSWDKAADQELFYLEKI